MIKTCSCEAYKLKIKELDRKLILERDLHRIEEEKLREALKKIKNWEFDIQGDCVADAKKLAEGAMREDTLRKSPCRCHPPSDFECERCKALKEGK